MNNHYIIQAPRFFCSFNNELSAASARASASSSFAIRVLICSSYVFSSAASLFCNILPAAVVASAVVAAAVVAAAVVAAAVVAAAVVAAAVVAAAVVAAAVVAAAVVAAAVVAPAVVAPAVVAPAVVAPAVVAPAVVAPAVVAPAVVAPAVVAPAVVAPAVVAPAVVAPAVVAPAVVAPAVVPAAVVVSSEQELLAGTGTLGSLQLHVRSVWTLRYALKVHRAWLCLVRGTPRMPMSLPYRSEPQAMVVDVMLLQITVCMFPVDWTVVKQLRNLSSGHLHTTSVVEPKTGAAEAAAAVELSDPGRQELSFFLIVVISFTPGTGLHFTCSVTSLKTLLHVPTFSPLLRRTIMLVSVVIRN